MKTKILVFSDSHGHIGEMDDIIDKNINAGGLSRVFFLGDGTTDIKICERTHPEVRFEYVAGNCDSFFGFTDDDVLLEILTTVAGKKFLLMHGHKYGVKSNTDLAVKRGIERGADFVLFGHTHSKCDETIDTGNGSIRLVNPGSIGDYFHRSFALITIDERGEVLVSICGTDDD